MAATFDPNNQDVEYYMRLSYTYCFIPESDVSFGAFIKEFPGCITFGDSLLDAYDMLLDAMRGWIETHIENGHPIPPPTYFLS